MGEMEAALAAMEAEAEAALRAAGSVVRELKKAKASAGVGNVRDLRKALENAEQLASQLTATIHALRAGWRLDELRYLSSGAYTKELLAQADSDNLAVIEQDDRLLCHPSVVRVLASEQAVQVDKTKHRTLRPSVVIGLLKAEQGRPPKFKPDAFLESLAAGYDLVVAREQKAYNATVRLVDVYEVLTLMPGQAREYTKQEFARDLYLLDQSGATRTKSGREVSLPASTLTKGGVGVLMTVSKTGQQKLYAGISFT